MDWEVEMDSDGFMNLVALPDMSEAEREVSEQEFRRGYRSGWMEATKTMHYMVKVKRHGINAAKAVCFNLWAEELRIWAHTTEGYLPPQVSVNKFDAVTPKLRMAIFKRDGFRCRICGRGVSDGARLETDHRVPVDAGGATTEDNLWTLCFECNRGKSADGL